MAFYCILRGRSTHVGTHEKPMRSNIFKIKGHLPNDNRHQASPVYTSALYNYVTKSSSEKLISCSLATLFLFHLDVRGELGYRK